MLRRKPLALLVGLLALALLVSASPASASYLLTRNARYPTLKVNRKGMALVSYRTPTGARKNVLVWGAVNARRPNPDIPQVRFKVDYSGGWGTFGYSVWKSFRNACRPYDGPRLPWFVTACKAPDGSYWALQRWQRMLPNYGVRPWKASQRVWELRVSHWTGDLAKLEIWLDWIQNGSFHHLFGRYTYRGYPIYGFSSTSKGVPTDSYGRNVYVDTYNSRYGSGWKRENSFLTHRPNGNFCYGFYWHTPPWYYPVDGRRPPGNGERYRATVIGPGVTPDVVWKGAGLPNFDPNNPQHVQHERAMNALSDSLIADDPDDRCTTH